MIHLMDEEILALAKVREAHGTYNVRELGQMEHLKFCKECYAKFCGALVLAEVTSESRYMLLTDTNMGDVEPLHSRKKTSVIHDMLDEQLLFQINITTPCYLGKEDCMKLSDPLMENMTVKKKQ